MAIAPTAGRTSRAVAAPLVLLLGAAVFLNYVDRGAIAVAAPLMKGELGLSATEFGTAVSALVGLAMLAGSGSGDIRDLAMGSGKERKPATGMVGRLIAAKRGGF